MFKKSCILVLSALCIAGSISAKHPEKKQNKSTELVSKTKYGVIVGTARDVTVALGNISVTGTYESTVSIVGPNGYTLDKITISKADDGTTKEMNFTTALPGTHIMYYEVTSVTEPGFTSMDVTIDGAGGTAPTSCSVAASATSGSVAKQFLTAFAIQ